MYKVELSGQVMRFDEVTAGVGVVRLEGTQMVVHSYCVDGVLIDTGSASLAAVFKPFFDSVSYDQIMLTHYHEDHIGNMNIVQSVPIFIHASSQPKTETPCQLPAYRQQYWGQPSPFISQALPTTFTSRTHTWQVIETPGHTQDHVAFLNESIGALFSGDLFVTPKPRIVLVDENIMDTWRSLKYVMQYDFDSVYCAHAGLLKNGKEMIQAKIDFIEHIIGEVAHARRSGMTLAAITEQIFPKTAPIVSYSNGEWSSTHIVRAILQEVSN